MNDPPFAHCSFLLLETSEPESRLEKHAGSAACHGHTPRNVNIAVSAEPDHFDSGLRLKFTNIAPFLSGTA